MAARTWSAAAMRGAGAIAVLSVRYATMAARPPTGKQRNCRPQDLRIIHAVEFDPPDKLHYAVLRRGLVHVMTDDSQPRGTDALPATVFTGPKGSLLEHASLDR